MATAAPPSAIAWWSLTTNAVRPPVEAFDHGQLPQGLGPGQLGGRDLADERGELAVASGAGRDAPPNVAAQVELGVLHPDRVPEPVGDLDHPPAQSRQSVEPGLHELDEARSGRGLRVRPERSMTAIFSVCMWAVGVSE